MSTESSDFINLELERRAIKTAIRHPEFKRRLDPDLFAGPSERELLEYVLGNSVADGFAELARGQADRGARAALVADVLGVTAYRSHGARDEAVKELDDLRALREAASVRDGLDASLDSLDADAVRAALPGVKRATTDSGEYLEDFEGRVKNQEGREEDHLIKTGFWEIDKRVGGLRRKEAGIVVGTSSSGKSLWLLQAAASAWLNGHSVLLFGLEMSREENELRLDAMLTQIEAMRFRRQNLSEKDVTSWKQEIAHYRKLAKKNRSWLQFASKRGASLEDVIVEMDRVEQSRSRALDLLVLDWLGLVKGKGFREQRHEKESRHADTLCELAIDRNMGIWTAAQSTDEGYSAKNGLKLTNVKYGRGVAETMPVVFGIDMTREQEAVGEIGFTCLKARGGPRGWTMLARADWERNVMDTRSWMEQNVRVMHKHKRGGK